MKTSTCALCVLILGALAACGGDRSAPGSDARKVETTGKATAALDDVPAEVIAAALAARPDLEITAAEYEQRDGREYYDVGGTMPDGSELELDMTRIDGTWTVVEFQRDIGMGFVPAPVSAALAGHAPEWIPERIIESDQGDGVVIYEFFGPGAEGETVKIEVRLELDEATVLKDEWQH